MKKKISVIIALIGVLMLLFTSGCKSKKDIKANEASFNAIVLEINGASVLVEPLEGEAELKSSDKISLNSTNLEDIDVTVGSVVNITYNGEIMESYPAQIKAEKWELIKGAVEHYFVAEILEVYEDSVLVSAIKGDNIDSIDKVIFSTANLPDIGVKVGSKIMVSYNGQVMYSYPAQINAITWKLL